MPMFNDPQAGNKALMKNIAKLATTMGEIGGAILGSTIAGPMGGAIGAELLGGGVKALGGGQSALPQGTASALGYLYGDHKEEEKRKRLEQAGAATGQAGTQSAGASMGRTSQDILAGYRKMLGNPRGQ